MAQKKGSKKASTAVITASDNSWYVSWPQLVTLGLVVFIAAAFYSTEMLYVQHVNNLPLAERTSNTTSNSLKKRAALSTATATKPSLTSDSPAHPALPTSSGGTVNSLSIGSTTTSTNVTNMATPGQATTLPLQQLTQSLVQATGSVLQAGQGTGGLDPAQL